MKISADIKKVKNMKKDYLARMNGILMSRENAFLGSYKIIFIFFAFVC